VPPLHPVIHHGDEHHRNEDHRRPVERLNINGRGVGPEGPEGGEHGVGGCHDVDGQAEFSQRPSRFGQRLGVSDFAKGDTGDADGVGGHERGQLETQDGVEGGVGAEVDQGEQDGDAEGEDGGIDGDVHGVVHTGDPGAEGQAAVACEGPGLAGAGGGEGDVADHEKEDSDDGEDVGAGDGAGHGELKDVEEGITGGVGEGVVDRWDGEEE